MQSLRATWRLGLVGAIVAGFVCAALSTVGAEEPPAPKSPDKPTEPPKEAPKGEQPKPAATTKTICEPLLAPAPAKEFALKDLDGKERKLSEFKGKWVVLEWTNYSCPFVKKHYAVTPAADGKPAVAGRMAQIQKSYTEKGVIWLSICSSADGQEGYMSPAKWKEAVKERMAAPTAVLLDADGKVGREIYGARRTPDMWIIDPKGLVAYHGAIDNDSAIKGDPNAAKNYVAEFLDAALAGKPLPANENKPYGCTVKYAN